MADRVFCIDLGSAYTKVALRRDPTATGELVRSKFTAVGEADFCIPSAVAVDRTGTAPKVECGYDAAGRSAGAGYDVFLNWKKRVFGVADTDPMIAQPPLTTLLQSPKFLELATEHGVSATQVKHLEALVASAQALAGTGSAAGQAARNRTNTSLIAQHYFKFLRRSVLEACAPLRESGLDPEKFPVRLAVPAFGNGKDLRTLPGCQLLTDALAKAGWPLHPDRPVVSEPYSNAIGVLTSGANAILKNRKIHIGKMFGNGPVLTVLKYPDDHPAFRAIVIDVGAFTTDFAAITLKPKDDKAFDLDVEFTFLQGSVPLGVTNLEADFRTALAQDKQTWLEKTAKPVELERVRKAVFTDRKPYKTVEVGAIGGSADADAVRDSLDGFTKQIQAEVAKFCDGLEPVALQELILTGGGNVIPAVREAVVATARGGGREFFRIHAPHLRKEDVPCRTDNLKDDMTRGGSAIGGASIYFEPEYN